MLQALAASRLVNSAGLCRDVRIAESLQTCLNTVICIARPIGRDGQLTLRFASAFLRAAARRTPSPMALRHALLRFVRSVLTVSPSVFRLRYEGTAKFSDCWALSSTADLLSNREPRERKAQQDYWGSSRKIGDQQIAHLTNTSESGDDRHKRDARPSRYHDELQSGYAHFSSSRGIAEKAMPTSRRIGGRELLGLTAGDRCLYISGRGAS